MTTFLSRIGDWLWRFLPDRCEAPGCGRRGVRGNENRVDVGALGTKPGRVMVLCDECSVLWRKAGWAQWENRVT